MSKDSIIERYKDSVTLYLEIGSHKFFVDPYGPKYSGAIGKIYTIDSPYNDTYLIQTDPLLDEGAHYPIDFIGEKDGLLLVKINYTGTRDLNIHNRDGLDIKLFPWSISNIRV